METKARPNECFCLQKRGWGWKPNGRVNECVILLFKEWGSITEVLFGETIKSTIGVVYRTDWGVCESSEKVHTVDA